MGEAVTMTSTPRRGKLDEWRELDLRCATTSAAAISVAREVGLACAPICRDRRLGRSALNQLALAVRKVLWGRFEARSPDVAVAD